jgi:acetyl esterase/lipase
LTPARAARDDPAVGTRRLGIVLIAAFSVLTAGCWPYVTPPGPAPLRYRDAIFTNVTKTAGLTYGTAVDQTGATVTLTYDLYTPSGDTDTHRSAIVWVHGGSFCCGDSASPEIVDEANTMAEEGYVNISINYRLVAGGCSASGPTSACIQAIVDAYHDAQSAVRYLRANAATYGVDPTRIAIAGTSAGAITALNVGYDSSDPTATVQAAVSLSGACLLSTPGSGDAPALLFHGTADTVVRYQWAVNTYNQAKAAGLQAWLISYAGDGHVPYVQHRTDILTKTSNFLYWALDLQHASS